MDKIIFLFLDVFMKRFHKNSSKNIYICYGRINFISNNISIGIFFLQHAAKPIYDFYDIYTYQKARAWYGKGLFVQVSTTEKQNHVCMVLFIVVL